MISSKLINNDNDREGKDIVFYAINTDHSLLNEDDDAILNIIADDEYNSSEGDFSFDKIEKGTIGNLSWAYEIVSHIDGDTAFTYTNNEFSFPSKNFVGSVRIKLSDDNDITTTRVVNFRKQGTKEYLILDYYINPSTVEWDVTESVLYYTGITIQDGVEVERVATSATISWDETNETNKVIDREGTLLTSFHSTQLDWLVKQNPKKVIGYSVLYGNDETEYDGDKQIITLTSSADNREMVNKGYLPIAVYIGEIEDNGTTRPLWVSVKKESNGYAVASETLATGSYKDSSGLGSNMGWGYIGESYFTDSGNTNGYEINQFYWNDMFADETRKNYLLNLTELTYNFNGDNSLLGGTHSTNNPHYWPLFYATYMLETPDGSKGKFYVPSIKEALVLTSNLKTWNTIMDWIGYKTSYGGNTKTCIEGSEMTAYDVQNNTLSTSNKGSGGSATLLYHYDLKGEYQPKIYKTLTITANDIQWNGATTTIKYSILTDGRYADGTEEKNVIITGKVISDVYEDNLTENPIEREITYSISGLTASTTFIQGAYTPPSQEYDLNGEWIVSDKTLDGYDVFMSNSNKGVSNSYASMKITFRGQPNFKLYINSYAEGGYDYAIAWGLDKDLPTAFPSYDMPNAVASTKGKQSNPTSINNFTEVGSYYDDEGDEHFVYENDGGEHFVWITYRKDGSQNENDDRGYVAIPKL